MKVSLATKAAARHRVAIKATVSVTGATATHLRVCLAGSAIGRQPKCWSLSSLAAGKSKTYTFTTSRSGKAQATVVTTTATAAAKTIKIR